MRIFVIGHEDSVLGFRLAGIEGFATDDPAAAEQKLSELVAAGDVGIVVVTADLARKLQGRIQEIEQTVTIPILLEVPAPGEPLQGPRLRDLVRRALGAGA